MDELDTDDPKSTISTISTDKFPLAVEHDHGSPTPSLKDQVDALRSRVQRLKAGIRDMRIILENKQGKLAHLTLPKLGSHYRAATGEPVSKNRKESLHSMEGEQFFSHFLPPAPPAPRMSDQALTADADAAARTMEYGKDAKLIDEHNNRRHNAAKDRSCFVSPGHPPGTTDYLLRATTFEGFSRARQHVRSSEEDRSTPGSKPQIKGAANSALFPREALALSSDSDSDTNTEDEEEAYAEACLRGGGGDTPPEEVDIDAAELSEEQTAILIRDVVPVRDEQHCSETTTSPPSLAWGFEGDDSMRSGEVGDA